MEAAREPETRSARERVAALARDGPAGSASVGWRVPGTTAAPDLDASALDPPTTPVPLVRPTGRLGSWAARWLPGRVPGWLRGARFDPGRPGALTLALVTAAAAVLAAVGVWWQRPVAEPAPPLAAGPPPSAPSAPSEPASAAAGTAGSAPAELVISVVGKVARPGLVRVPDGARVADTLAAAGGALPGTDLVGLNMARRVADGEQVVVGLPQPADAGAAAAGGADPAGQPAPTQPGAPGRPGAAGRVDLNRATLQQLDGLPGVGPVTAQRILDWRTQHGRFGRIEQLREIDGIGERRFAQLRDLVSV